MPPEKNPTDSPTSPILSNNPQHFNKSRFIFISMAVFLSLAILSLILFITISSSAVRHPSAAASGGAGAAVHSNQEIIGLACRASRDPTTCQASLTQSNRVPPDATVLQVIESAVWVASQNLKTGRKMVQDILDSSAGDKNRSVAAKTGLEVLTYAEYRLNLVDGALTRGGNVVILGDGMGKTVITGSLNVGLLVVSTYNSATVGVLGDGFMASGLTIQNTAGPGAYQAVAFRSDSDLSVIENCEFIGNQDTLYAHSLRQYYKSCRIQGNIDFIFGNSASYFQDCLILISPRQIDPEKGENNAVTAQGRIDPSQSTGFVFQNCVINGTDDYVALYNSNPSVHKNYLGRPWKLYSRTVFIGCTLESLIAPDGWMIWDGDFALKTLYYGEFENSGPGSDTSKRVNWSSVIPAERAYAYTVQNFLQGDQWIPASS
ncbi:PREDICTED: probable pectinesterase/pectinesterase inhibitor 51 [Erythranthe guttata]|nr:PREDICTED: probable pectinesterase/pectinesterase inhibitor 51 [Erythranthe guttata]|eukprot:XP_012853738.1 PREDICTED: probable pectinesterase/pectinesterase inhibitor 51 [Erythranthe guttata]